MHILHIITSGADMCAADTVLGLHGAGVDQCVAAEHGAPGLADMQRAGVRCEFLPPLRFLARLRLRRLIARVKPDAIQCWTQGAARLLPSCRVPSIGWLGACDDPGRFSGCTHFVGATADIAVHLEKSGVPAARAHFIPVARAVATTPPLDRALLTTPRDAKVLLAPARLHPDKGLDLLLAALKELPDCHVWLVGEGPLRHELEELAQSLGVFERLRFAPPRADYGALLRAGDLCVLPSRREPTDIVIASAWAAGTPLIACPAVAGRVEDGITALLAPSEDPAALAAVIRRALGDEELRRRLVAQGYAAYIKNYAREAVIQKWIALYKKLSGEKALSRAA